MYLGNLIPLEEETWDYCREIPSQHTCMGRHELERGEEGLASLM
jgi:hypothetical protein